MKGLRGRFEYLNLKLFYCISAWGRLDRWERRERIGESVPLTGKRGREKKRERERRERKGEREKREGEIVKLFLISGQFAAVGLLAQSVHDAQNVVHDFDTKNEVRLTFILQFFPFQFSWWIDL